MANIVNCIGYTLGKVHTGLLAFLCQLHQEGTREPLEVLLGHLGVQLPSCPRPEREWESVDLAIFDSGADAPAVLIEMKVDDHDTEKRIGSGAKKTQTELYTERFPNCHAYLYITVGNGEYFQSPRGLFRWVRLREFSDALATVKTTEKSILDWQKALGAEIQLREIVKRGDYHQVAKLNPRRQWRSWWNLCFLGQLKERLASRFPDCFPILDAACYYCGTAPDTILNFGWVDDVRYLEINNNGFLNFKVTLGEEKSEAKKRELIDGTLRWIAAAYPARSCEYREGGRIGKSKTVACFDIGLRCTDGVLQFDKDEEYTVQKLRQFLEPLYRAPR